MSNVITVKGVAGDFNVVREGEFVTFYDARYPSFGVYGQQVSKYYISTILEDDGRYGLCLDGGVPDWTVPRESMQDVVKFLKK